MSQCPNCGHVYDESEYALCPKCTKNWKVKFKKNTLFTVKKSVK